MPNPGQLQFPAARDTLKTLIQAANNAFTTLTAQLSAGAATMTVSSTALFPDSGIWVCENEIGTYDGKTATTLTNLTRGEQGMTDATHANGSTIEILVTARDHNVLAELGLALEDKLGTGLSQAAINQILRGTGPGASAWGAMQAADLPSSLNQILISVVWASPGAESGNAIEIQASCQDFAGNAFASGLVDVQIVVSDAANDSSPSATATIAAAGTPVGSILDGAGTATVIVRTDSNGIFKIKVSEPSAGSRYLWLSPGGHSRLHPRSSTGVQQLTFA